MTAPAKPTNRRASARRRARRAITLQCRRGAMGLGPNLCTGLLDVSERGVQLLLKESLKPGDEVEVVLDGHGLQKAIRRMAQVRWVQSLPDGQWCAGVRFEKLLSYRELQTLAL